MQGYVCGSRETLQTWEYCGGKDLEGYITLLPRAVSIFYHKTSIRLFSKTRHVPIYDCVFPLLQTSWCGILCYSAVFLDLNLCDSFVPNSTLPSECRYDMKLFFLIDMRAIYGDDLQSYITSLPHAFSVSYYTTSIRFFSKKVTGQAA
jgi:hypothetical protein